MSMAQLPGLIARPVRCLLTRATGRGEGRNHGLWRGTSEGAADKKESQEP
jgi:hypothetical protein